jgi:hypothetical protein
MTQAGVILAAGDPELVRLHCDLVLSPRGVTGVRGIRLERSNLGIWTDGLDEAAPPPKSLVRSIRSVGWLYSAFATLTRSALDADASAPSSDFMRMWP